MKSHLPWAALALAFFLSSALNGAIFKIALAEPSANKKVLSQQDSATTAGEVKCKDCENRSEELSATITNALAKMISDYSNSNQVQRAIAFAMKYKEPRFTRQCYKYVKNALDHAKLVAERLPGKWSADALEDLESAGYLNLLKNEQMAKIIKSPYDAPKGAILVYAHVRDKKRGRPGHIEFKIGDSGEGGFVSDFYSPNARTGIDDNDLVGRGTKLVGVFIKPGVN